MKKIIIGMSALTLVTSTLVFANNRNETKKATVSCSKGCPKTTNCKAETTWQLCQVVFVIK